MNAELGAAGADIRAAYIDLQAADAGNSVQLSGQLGIFIDRFPGDINDYRDVPFCPERCFFGNEGFHPDVLQADGVEHARGRLHNARLRVTIPGFKGGTLADDGAETLYIKKVIILGAVAEGAGRGHDRVGQM